ncbi:MAG: YkgJ family cysteine cluster protein [Candidatus Dadabacteria bacterium]|nr:MAG: YkgJ family cysteine cluster protein [Candidatus Dadabacteria bacterium]
MVEDALEDLESEGEEISCRKGCNHCCHLLVEVSWEEATELANWVLNLPHSRRERFLGRIRKNAAEARELFLSDKKAHRFLKPADGEEEIPDHIFDRYFYGKRRPCPFLELGACAAYEVRPTPCRLHMVTTDPELCSAESEEQEYETHQRLEELQEQATPVIQAAEKTHLWGQLGIMVEAAYQALIENNLTTKADNNNSEVACDNGDQKTRVA